MQRSKVLLFIATWVLMFVALPAYADDVSRDREIAERFKICDVNQDGKLTQEEAKGCMPRIYDHFSMIDSNNQGYVTVAEIQATANR
jgi:Ca2+-binding EF-hand superfamily protein